MLSKLFDVVIGGIDPLILEYRLKARDLDDIESWMSWEWSGSIVFSCIEFMLRSTFFIRLLRYVFSSASAEFSNSSLSESYFCRSLMHISFVFL